MKTLNKITRDLELWEKEFTDAKSEYDEFVMKYQKSHPDFASRLEKAWKETTENFWGIEVKYKKSLQKALQQNEPQRTLDRYQAKLLKKIARTQAIRKYEGVKGELLKEAVMHEDTETEISKRLKQLMKRYEKANNQKQKLQKSLKRFLNSSIFREQNSIGYTEIEYSY